MPAFHDVAHDVRVRFGLVTNHEKRRLHACFVEHVEDARRVHGTRTIVECEGNTPGIIGAMTNGIDEHLEA